MPKCRYSTSLPVIKTNAHQAKQSRGGGALLPAALSNLLNPLQMQYNCCTATQVSKVSKRPKLSHAAHGWMSKQWSAQSVGQSLWLWKPHPVIVRRIINKTNQDWLRYVHVLVKWNVSRSPSFETTKTAKQRHGSQTIRGLKRERKTFTNKYTKSAVWATDNSIASHLTISLIFLWALAWYPLWAQTLFTKSRSNFLQPSVLPGNFVL